MFVPPSSRTISVPRLLQVRARAHDSTASELAAHFDLGCVVVVTGHDRSRSIAESLCRHLEEAGSATRLVAGVEGTLAAAASLLSQLDDSPASVAVAVGGGQPIDVAKLAAARAGIDMVAVPTTLSHDGMSSPVASLRAEDGRRRSLGARMPSGVVIDLDVIAAAPLRYLRAGVGDLVSNITAVEDWRAAEAAGGGAVDEFAASIAVLGAHSALEIEWPPSPPDVETLARGLVMSGLAMEVAGSSRPCSGAEHLVSHALDEIRGEAVALHGEHVALGVVLTAGLHGGVTADRIRDLFGRVGLPLTLAEAGIDRSTMVEAVRRAPSTRPGRATALDAPLRDEDGAERLVDRAFGRRVGVTDLLVLAAGLGRRLASRSVLPKWLTPVGDTTPADRQLGGAVAAGVGSVRVVVSDVGGPIADAIAPWRDQVAIRLVGNDHAHDRNNWYSLLLGLDDWLETDGPSVAVLNSDLFATSTWFAGLLAAGRPAGAAAALAVDAVRPLTDEAMKVAVDGDHQVAAIGKVGVDEPFGEYVGLSWWSRASALELQAILGGFASDPDRADCWYEHGIQEHVGAGANYHVVPVPSTAWVEIDDAADLDAARALPDDPAR